MIFSGKSYLESKFFLTSQILDLKFNNVSDFKKNFIRRVKF